MTHKTVLTRVSKGVLGRLQGRVRRVSGCIKSISGGLRGYLEPEPQEVLGEFHGVFGTL